MMKFIFIQLIKYSFACTHYSFTYHRNTNIRENDLTTEIKRRMVWGAFQWIGEAQGSKSIVSELHFITILVQCIHLDEHFDLEDVYVPK